MTITVDEQVAKWARVWAAEHDSSVSRLVGELLKEKMQQERDYDLAQSDFFSRKPAMLREPGESYPKRDQLHERSGVR